MTPRWPLSLERGQNSDGEGQFTFETQDAEISPKLNRVIQMNGNKSFERQGSGAGRSQAMSIIQSPASDLSHQQITTQLQLLHGVIDKRLTQLEDVYVSTFSRLDKLAESQEMLVRLVKQLMHQQREKTSPLAVETEQDKLLASIV
ncbi:hypothetical protein Btru_002028 [Bulinus truncatus]|nr:hypothetical protein Btru_002028 [Bulinus truncatus]